MRPGTQTAHPPRTQSKTIYHPHLPKNWLRPLPQPDPANRMEHRDKGPALT